MNYSHLKTNAIYPMAIAMALMLPVSQSFAICFFGCSQSSGKDLYINQAVSAPQQAEKLKVLQDLQEEMLGSFTRIEELLSSNNNPQALREAKKVLDTVRVKTGIDPKSKITESFLVPIVFPADSARFDLLDKQQQYQVIKSIRDFRGGLYMDIMNLSKRTTLLYVKAFKAVVQQNGGLKEDDRNKIINDLVRASLIPMTVEDKKGKQIIVFDEDVSNEDHIYLFNRELKIYLNSETDLGVNEKMFNVRREYMKNSFIPKSFVDPQMVIECINVGGQMLNVHDHERFEKGMSYARSCFDTYYQSLASYDHCKLVASQLYIGADPDSAQAACFDYYKK